MLDESFYIGLSIEMQMTWTFDDGWILMALDLAQCWIKSNRPVTLAEIIRAADALNHSIPNEDELSTIFTKFLQHSLITICKDGYRIAAPYQATVSKVFDENGGIKSGLVATSKRGLKWLKTAGIEVNNQEKVLISKEAVHDSYEEYLAYIKELGF